MSAQRKLADDAGLSLAARLKERIAREGPISVADYMQACLTDEREGYYTSRQPIGAEGDFVTAPEVSQIFGELLGLWAVAVWQSMGAPQSVVLAELGPGRGTLMADALRASRLVPAFRAGLRVALIETSPVLRRVQQETLRGAEVPLLWYQRIEDVTDGPLIVLANEFIDALPVRQLVRRDGAWRERAVGIDQHGAFSFVEGAVVHDDTLPPAPDGATIEARPAVVSLLASLAARAANAPLAALIVDYGHEETGTGDTLQAVHRHRYADPLSLPGEIDLTAHVDFAALKQGAEAFGIKTYGPMPQGEFLLRLGLGERRDKLLAAARPEQRQAILSGAARLADPAQMGLLFKALALTSDGLAPPPPFGDI